MNPYRTLPLVALMVAAFGGCATTPEPEHDAMMAKLEHYNRDIQQRWGVTSQLSTLKHVNDVKPLQVSKLDDAMRQVVTFPGGYQGELAKLVEEFAALANYEYLAPAGSPPIQGIPIAFADQYRTLGEYVYDAGMQAGARATVVMDLHYKSLQVVYTGY